MEMNYASKGVANAGLTTGVIGTALGVLNGAGGLLGGMGWGNYNGYGCGVNHYELSLMQALACEQTKSQKLESEKYTDNNILETYKYIDGRLRDIEGEICNQKVYNATNTATIGCIANQVNDMQRVFGRLTRVVIPNDSICPGWGEVTVTTTSATTTTPATT